MLVLILLLLFVLLFDFEKYALPILIAARAPPLSTYIGPDRKGLSIDSMEGGGVRSSVMLRGTGARLSNLCHINVGFLISIHGDGVGS